MDVLSSRILLRPSDLDRSRRFYRDLLGLAIYREFGPPDDPGLVFFLGQGLLEVSGHAAGPPVRSVMIWIQVRDVRAEHARLAAAGVPIVREPAAEPWGLTEMWIEDPDGIRIVLVEVPADHPLRRDPRSALPLRWQHVRPSGYSMFTACFALGTVILDTLESRKEGTWAGLIKELQEEAEDELRDTLDHLLTLSAEPTPSSLKIFTEWVQPVRRYLIHPGEVAER